MNADHSNATMAELSGHSFNWAAGLAWIVTLAACLTAVFIIGRWSLWFVSLPGWFVAAILYIVLSRFYQKSVRPAEAA